LMDCIFLKNAYFELSFMKIGSRAWAAHFAKIGKKLQYQVPRGDALANLIKTKICRICVPRTHRKFQIPSQLVKNTKLDSALKLPHLALNA
jgi:hypothetical protein